MLTGCRIKSASVAFNVLDLHRNGLTLRNSATNKKCAGWPFWLFFFSFDSSTALRRLQCAGQQQQGNKNQEKKPFDIEMMVAAVWNSPNVFIYEWCTKDGVQRIKSKQKNKQKKRAWKKARAAIEQKKVHHAWFMIVRQYYRRIRG